MGAIQHKAGDNCWCKEKHTNLEAMRLNARDIPKSKDGPKWGSKKKKGKNPKGHY